MVFLYFLRLNFLILSRIRLSSENRAKIKLAFRISGIKYTCVPLPSFYQKSSESNSHEFIRFRCAFFELCSMAKLITAGLHTKCRLYFSLISVQSSQKCPYVCTVYRFLTLRYRRLIDVRRPSGWHSATTGVTHLSHLLPFLWKMRGRFLLIRGQQLFELPPYFIRAGSFYFNDVIRICAP